MCPLFPNFGLKRFFVFRSNLLPLRVCEVVLFNCTTWKSYFFHQIWIFKTKLAHSKLKLSRKQSVSKHLGEEGEFVSSCFRTCEGNVANYTQFVSYKMLSMLALPSCLLKVPNTPAPTGSNISSRQPLG